LPPEPHGGRGNVPSRCVQAISNAGAKSVKFVSAEAGVSRIEGSAPWAFLGNNGNVYSKRGLKAPLTLAP
jgi:hypothetical protein